MVLEKEIPSMNIVLQINLQDFWAAKKNHEIGDEIS